ncbi:MAG: hypothetical protein CVU38_19775 [Chloroflexi bacterium HGW-Chloroflexi-1]|nr:MAG: hypothetical protein CVU38_19775 [Chloroflexi bacterium HGW-Chloroflexi-1]
MNRSTGYLSIITAICFFVNAIIYYFGLGPAAFKDSVVAVIWFVLGCCFAISAAIQLRKRA